MAPPTQFALFNTTTSISTNIIGELLSSAQTGAKDQFNDNWYFKYVPSHVSLLGATLSNDSTQPPVENTKPEFIHHTLDQLVSVLKDAPQSMALNRTYFAVVDERTMKDKSLVLCYADRDETKGVHSVRCLSKNATLYLVGQAMACGSWDELESASERQQQEGGGDVLD